MKKFYFVFLFLLAGLWVSGQSTEVGVTEGELSVSLTGAANYKIPIAVPPGINGMVPQLSLVYNSQGGLGLAGFGWNIIGISAITRVPSTMYHDGVIDPVDFNDLDRFALDDKRLILKSSEKFDVAATKRIYETEIFSNLKISYYTGQIQDNRYQNIVFIPIDYFVVEYPDGSIAKYENHGSATDWTISHWENQQGACVIYEYSPYTGASSSTNNAVIEKIKYGSLKSSSTQINEIQFVYKPHYTNPQVYVGGKSFIRNKILSEIIIKSNDIGFRSYSLTQDVSSLRYPRLKSIVETSGNGSKSYNSTVFEYEKNQPGLVTPIMEVSGKSNAFDTTSYSNEVVTGDFDGDGDLEFLQSNSGELSLHKILDNYQVADLAKVNNAFPYAKIYAINSLDKNSKFSSKQNICVYHQIPFAGKYAYKIYSYNKIAGTLELDYEKVVPDSFTGPYGAGDFDGDGLTELISYKSKDGRNNVELINLDRNKTSDFITEAGFIDIGVIRYGDINGDGKTDLIVFRGSPYNDITVYTLKNNVFTKLFRTKQDMPENIGGSKWGRREIFPIVMGDFNGDGKTDIFLVDLKKILLSTGGDYFVEESLLAYIPQDYENFVPEIIFAFDYNNDGKTDILSIKPTPTGYLNRSSVIDANVFYRTNSWFNAHFNIKSDAAFGLKLVPLFTRKNNNDSSKTDLALLSQFNVSFFTNNSYLEGQNLLKSITLGNGVKETITYASLNDGDGVYTAGNSQFYPNMDMRFNTGFKVVSKFEKQSASQYKKQLFQYYGAVMNLEGLGFLGFGSTLKTNWHDNASPIISYISKNDMSLRGANIENYAVLGLHEPLIESDTPKIPDVIVKKDAYTIVGTENLVASESITLKPNTWIKPGSTFSAKINTGSTSKSINEPSTFITKSVLAYESELFANKVFKIKNISKKHFNGLENTSSETKTDYDSYNNPVKISTDVKESSTVKQTTITDITYQSLTSPFIIGRPLSKIQNVSLGNEKMRTEETYAYNNAQLLSTIKKKGDTGTNYVIEDRLYDTFGNITKRTLKAGQDSREFSYEYDLSGRFLTKETDAEKLVTTYQYNTNGTLKSTINPLSQATSFEYDSWFRKKTETDYLANKNEYKYENNNGNTIITKTFADGSATEETYDDLGRKIKSGSKNIMGTFTYVSSLYDLQDRNYKTSQPYIGSSASQWNETLYDDYGRITDINDFTGKSTHIAYTGLTSKVNDGTVTKTYKKDAVGNIISMSDVASNEIKYTYFPNGDLKESDYDGTKIKVVQDGWGRKIELHDPSAGIIKYKYNDFGELTSEENKNGTTSYQLTSAGRIEGKTISGLFTKSKTTYTYDANKLLLNAKFEDLANGTNSITTVYAYDTQKRLTNKTETTPYAVFSKDFSYDSYGRLDTEGSIAKISGKSSSKTVQYTYKNGAAYQILDGTNVLWQANTVTAAGQIKTAKSGPLTITNDYDAFGYNSEFKFDKTTPLANILVLNTKFNAKTGTLDSRKNSLFSLNESFKYDELDRVKEFTNIKGVLETQSYDDKGRITQNSLGVYAYSKTSPYQNESITTTADALAYYTAKPLQTIDYNVFKSPVLITEKNVDLISFDYNDNNSRTAMFYGGLQVKKVDRPYHKYYSDDGTMEIKENTVTKSYDFITYIGGDGYTAPVVYKSDGATNQKYLYLQRDYQGSIVAITDQNGAVVEKRLFDAWGAIAKVQDGNGNTLAGLTILDRGYTGHEHLQSVGIINMNGRLYDPKLHRFLQPDNNIQDPFNTQNYNRYGYVMNNPLRYTDPSGEIWDLILGFGFSLYVHGGAASGGQSNPFKWDSNAWTSAFSGAASSAGSYYASSYATGVANNYLDNYNNKPALGASAIGSGYGDVSAFSSVSSLTGSPVFDNGPGDNVGNWYEPGGKVNWAFGLSATIGGIKGGLNSERMYTEGIRRGISENYTLSGRNLSMFRDAPATKASLPISKVGRWAKMVGEGSFYAGLIMDGIGVWNYTNDPDSPNAVHPYKFMLNTYMGATGTYGGTLMAITSALYFGIDAFYTKSGGGWKGLGIDQESLYRDNKAINPNYQAFPGAMKI